MENVINTVADHNNGSDSMHTYNDGRIMQGDREITANDNGGQLMLAYTTAQIQDVQLTENGDVIVTLRNDGHTDDSPSVRKLIFKDMYAVNAQGVASKKKKTHYMISKDHFELTLPQEIPASPDGTFPLKLKVQYLASDDAPIGQRIYRDVPVTALSLLLYKQYPRKRYWARICSWYHQMILMPLRMD